MVSGIKHGERHGNNRVSCNRVRKMQRRGARVWKGSKRSFWYRRNNRALPQTRSRFCYANVLLRVSNFLIIVCIINLIVILSHKFNLLIYYNKKKLILIYSAWHAGFFIKYCQIKIFPMNNKQTINHTQQSEDTTPYNP